MDAHSLNLYDIDLLTIDGKPQKMDVYRSKTLLIVNVASQCGFTPQYVGLQALYWSKNEGQVLQPNISRRVADRLSVPLPSPPLRHPPSDPPV